MSSERNYRVASFVSGLAIKAPCVTISLVNVATLSGAGQTIGGYITSVGDRVVLAGQTDARENGIWNVETSAWQRAGDFDGNRDVVGGTIIPVWRQSMADYVLYQVDGLPDPVIITEDNISISEYYDATSAGIPEAPQDGMSYVRNNASWVLESAGNLPNPAVSSVLAGDGTGSNWVVASNITINSSSGTINTQGSVSISDGTDQISMNCNAGVLTMVGTGGYSYTDHIPNFRMRGGFYIQESPTGTVDFSGYGQFYVESEGDNVPMFKSDIGTVQLLDPSRSDVNEQNGNYTTVLADKGKTIRKASGGAGETLTIAAEANVPYKIGTFIGFDNDGGGTVTIDVDGADTLIFADDGTTGARTLGDGGFAVAFKNAAGQWKIAGKQLT